VEQPRLRSAILVVGAILVVLYLAAGIVGGALIDFDGDVSDRVLWIVFLVGGAAVLGVGLYLLRDAATMGAAIAIAVGALAGGVPLFWTVLVPLVAIALAVTSIVYARGRSRPPATA
jgi:hypothetical protein